jgi:hypothetical protein
MAASAAFAVVGVGVALGGGVDTPAAFWRALAGADGAAYDKYDGRLDVRRPASTCASREKSRAAPRRLARSAPRPRVSRVPLRGFDDAPSTRRRLDGVVDDQK